MNELDGYAQPSNNNENVGSLPLITYVLYLVGLFVPLTTIVGLIMAYISKDDCPPWIESHYRWLIRTFWISLLWGFVGAISLVIAIGYAILVVGGIWYIIRVVRGFVNLQNHKPISNPASWGV